MDNFFGGAKWIWLETELKSDVYADFLGRFDYIGGKTDIILSCDTVCNVFVNGNLAFFGQYPDYPFYKIAEKFDITKYCKKGENLLEITVWHCGLDSTQVYYPAQAGLIFSVRNQGGVLLESGANTRARLNPYYKSGYNKIITVQLGQSFLYDATNAPVMYGKAKVTDKKTTFFKRPIKDLVLTKKPRSCVIKQGKGSYLIDLGKEYAGFPTLKFNSENSQKLTVAFGQHLKDGNVRRLIGARDFSFEYVAKSGANDYINRFRRISCRYLEVFCGEEIDIEYIGLTPVEYPVAEIVFDAKNTLKQRIYQTCVYTLKLCMHDHYEDTPWREQALYALDSRNQMLCGYYAFGEYEFARANLVLLSKALRDDGFLSICAPTGFDLPIPLFSLIYPVQVYEYIHHSKDESILDEVFPTIDKIMRNFISSVGENNLISNFAKPCWNFYEWSDGSDNWQMENPEQQYDLILNCAFLYAFQYYKKLLKMKDENTDFETDKMIKAVNDTFYEEGTGLYVLSGKDKRCSRLGNAFAVISGVCADKKALANKMINDKSLIAETLSMKGFVYDALLSADKNYKQYILKDIEKNYKYMLDNGATTVWETIKGEADFDGAGSLCHGWSAMPVYYYNILKE